MLPKISACSWRVDIWVPIKFSRRSARLLLRPLPEQCFPINNYPPSPKNEMFVEKYCNLSCKVHWELWIAIWVCRTSSECERVALINIHIQHIELTSTRMNECWNFPSLLLTFCLNSNRICSLVRPKITSIRVLQVHTRFCANKSTMLQTLCVCSGERYLYGNLI